jgi:ArsR family transcriptional regulator
MTETSFESYQRLYDRMAPFYAGAMRLVPMWRAYIEATLPWLDRLPASATVLEIGPGPGVLLARLAARFRTALAVDLSIGMLRRAQRRLDAAGLPAGVAQANATALPFAGNSFDAAVLTFAFSAMPDGQGAMAEIARVLRPAGWVVLVDACVPSNGNHCGVGLARLWEQFDDYLRDEAGLMRQAGLAILERREFGAFTSIRLTVGQKDSTG